MWRPRGDADSTHTTGKSGWRAGWVSDAERQGGRRKGEGTRESGACLALTEEELEPPATAPLAEKGIFFLDLAI